MTLIITVLFATVSGEAIPYGKPCSGVTFLADSYDGHFTRNLAGHLLPAIYLWAMEGIFTFAKARTTFGMDIPTD